MKIAIIGAGALGLYYGSLLARHSPGTGVRVTFLGRSDYDVLRERGIIVHSIRGDFRLENLNVVKEPEQLGKQHLIIIGLKATSNASLRNLLLPAITPSTAVLTLQNGLGNEEHLSDFLPPKQILGGAAFLCSNRIGPAEILHTDYGAVSIAPFSPQCVVAAETLADIFKASSIECTAESNLLEVRFRKQVWNVPFNTLCTIHDAPTSHILSSEDLLLQTQRIMREIVELGRVANQKRNSDWNIQRSFSLSEETVSGMIEKTRTMGDYLPSMLLDRRAGRALESQSIVYNCLSWRDQYASELPLAEVSLLSEKLRALEATGSTY